MGFLLAGMGVGGEVHVRLRFLPRLPPICCLYNRPHHPPVSRPCRRRRRGVFLERLLYFLSSHSRVPAAAASHSIGGAALFKKERKKGSYGQPCLTRDRPRSCFGVWAGLGGFARGKGREMGGTMGVKRELSATQPSGNPSGRFSLLSPPL